MKLFSIFSMMLAAIPLALLDTPEAHAAQDSTIVNDNAPIRTDPKEKSNVLEYLPMGAEVRISNFPMPGGWYKIRSKTGAYGWIQEKDLSVYKAPPDAAPDDLVRPERDRKWFIRALGGFDFFKPDDINDIFGFQDLNTGYMLGGEIGRFVTDQIAVALRTEALVKDTIAKEIQSGIFYNLALRAYPIMGGVDFRIVKLPAMRLSIGLFGGLAAATSFASEATALKQPNIMVLQRSPFTGLVRANLTRPLGRILSVFAEAGYRYLQTDAIDTVSATGVNGGIQVYAKSGSFRTRVIDLSGATLAIGIGVHF